MPNTLLLLGVQRLWEHWKRSSVQVTFKVLERFMGGCGVDGTKRHTLRHRTLPRMGIEAQNLAVPFGELADVPAEQLGMIHMPRSFSRTARMEAYPGSTDSYQNPRTTS